MKKVKKMLFCDYFDLWVDTYKRGSIREVTLAKYLTTSQWLHKLAPELKLKHLDRQAYQTIINEYAETHEKGTVKDFNTHLKACITDAIDEGLLKKDPTKRVQLKGKIPKPKKQKFLSSAELHTLLDDLDLDTSRVNYDWLILLLAKTGLRFSEAVALTVNDFNFDVHTLNVNKTLDYKHKGGFVYTKNDSSIRTVAMDNVLNDQLKELCKHVKDKDEPIFLLGKGYIYNSTVNDVLVKHCKNCNITEISLHSLRHTHASILLSGDVTLQSISKRLGHANTTTTQKVYLHIIRELETKDSGRIEETLSNL